MNIYDSLIEVFDLKNYFDQNNIEQLSALDRHGLLNFTEALDGYEDSIHLAAKNITKHFYILKKNRQLTELEYLNEELSEALKTIRKYQSINYVRITLHEWTGVDEDEPELLEQVNSTIQNFTVGYIGSQILFLRQLNNTILNPTPISTQIIENKTNTPYFEDPSDPPVVIFFKDFSEIQKFVNLLKDEENPILTMDNKMIGKNMVKFCSWVNLLQDKGHLIKGLTPDNKKLILKQLFGLDPNRTLFGKTRESQTNIEYIESITKKYSQTFS